jgi:RecB family endonuclease NucS
MAEIKYSPGEKEVHRTIKEKVYKHFNYKLHQDIIKIETEYPIQAKDKNRRVVDVYIETKKYILIVEVKTGGATREGMKQLIRAMKDLKTKKEIIPVLVSDRITETVICNVLAEKYKHLQNKFIYLTYDKDYKINRFTPKYKIA